MSDHRQTVRTAFDQAAAGYDALRRKLVPDFDVFYGTVVEVLAMRFEGRVFRCLDLGTGTGLLAEMVLDRRPAATVTGLDSAEAMAAQARRRLARFGARAQVTVADYADTPLPGPVDAVISALSIHHLAHEDKRRVFAAARAALTAGGLFINADQVLGPTPAMEAEYEARWQANAQAAGVGAADLAATRERMKTDRCATLADQIAWIAEAGFAWCDVAWKRYRFAVFVAGTV